MRAAAVLPRQARPGRPPVCRREIVIRVIRLREQD